MDLFLPGIKLMDNDPGFERADGFVGFHYASCA